MFKGSLTALITPFSGDAIDEQAFCDLIDWQIDQGSHGLVPCGTTGESPTLSHAEHRRLVELCVDKVAGRVPVVAGTGSNSTREALELTRHAADAGADAALIVTPYYNKPTQEGLVLHFQTLADEGGLPILIYNIPGRSVIDMSSATMARLARHRHIVGVKDATGDLARVAEQRLKAGTDFIQLSGEDATAVGFNAMGGVGCISVTANVAPAACAEMQSAMLAGDFATALALQDRLLPLHQALFAESSPGPVKYAAARLGLCDGTTRAPLAPIADATAALVDAALAGLELV